MPPLSSPLSVCAYWLCFTGFACRFFYVMSALCVWMHYGTHMSHVCVNVILSVCMDVFSTNIVDCVEVEGARLHKAAHPLSIGRGRAADSKRHAVTVLYCVRVKPLYLRVVRALLSCGDKLISSLGAPHSLRQHRWATPLCGFSFSA